MQSIRRRVLLLVALVAGVTPPLVLSGVAQAVENFGG